MSDHSLKDRLGRFLDGTWQGAKRVQGIQGGARAYALSLVAAQGRRSILIVAATAREAENLYDDLTFFLAKSGRCRRCAAGCTCFLPGKFCRSKAIAPSGERRGPPGRTLQAHRRAGADSHRHARRIAAKSNSQGRAQAVLSLPRGRADVGAGNSPRAFSPVGLSETCHWWRSAAISAPRRHRRSVFARLLPPAAPRIRRRPPGVDPRVQPGEPALRASPRRYLAPADEGIFTPALSMDDILRKLDQRAADLEMDRREKKSLLESLREGIPFPGMEFLAPIFIPSWFRSLPIYRMTL